MIKLNKFNNTNLDLRILQALYKEVVSTECCGRNAIEIDNEKLSGSGCLFRRKIEKNKLYTIIYVE